MINIVYGPRGTGKTRLLVDKANRMSDDCSGVVVFIDNSNHLMYDLKHNIRFTNISEYPVENVDSLLGFICGILSQNYDVEGVFIDSLSYIIGEDINRVERFLNGIERVSSDNNIKFYMSVNGHKEDMPGCIKKYAI